MGFYALPAARNNGARRDQVAAFLRELVAGKEVRPAFESVFGTTFAAMEKELRNYVERRTFVGTLVTLRAKLTFDATMRSAPMTEHSAKSVLGDLLYRKNRLDEAEAHLREALAAEPDSAVANASLGMVRMRQNKFSEARSLLEKAIAKDSSGHLVHYYYAYIISRESFGPGNMVDGFSDEAAAKMRTALKKAIQISPEFPESYSLLAFISLVRNDEIDEAVKYIEQALKLSPGNQNYQLHLAGLYMRRREFDRARSLAQAVHRAASDQEIRVRAESVLQNIQSFSEFVEAVKSTGPQGPPRLGRTAVTAEDREPTAEEIAKMRARAQLEVINEALRNPRSGEKRLLGYLSKIECTRSGVIYTVKSGSDILKLRSKDFQELDLMTYVPEFNGEFGCDGPAAEVFAVLTYLVAEDAKTKTAGQLLAIEVVPKDFEFIEPQN